MGRSALRNGIPALFSGSALEERPSPGGLQGAHKRAGWNPAAAAISSYADAYSPARGLTFSAMTPNAVKRRRFRTKRDEAENFLAAPTEPALLEGVEVQTTLSVLSPQKTSQNWIFCGKKVPIHLGNRTQVLGRLTGDRKHSAR